MMSSEEELKSMIKLLNEKAFSEPGPSRLELQMQDRPDIGGVLAFMVLVQDRHVNIDQKTVVRLSPITLCWGGGTTVDSACETVIRKFAVGSDLIRKYLPVTAGSFAELKIKAAAYYG